MNTQAYQAQLSQIHRVIYLFSDSFQALNVRVPAGEIERLAFFVHQTMQGTKRKFHNTDHVLDICQGMNPLQTLAGLFHDVVYWQVDEDFPPQKRDFLLQWVAVEQGEIRIREDIPQIENTTKGKLLVFEILLHLFGFERGQKLSTMSGLNEFLSAFLAIYELKTWLSWKNLLAIAACIEGTIPFRHLTPQGISYWERLAQKLQEIAQKYEINLPENETQAICLDALHLANRDVANFAHEKIGFFLDGTWRLLPETNTSMRQAGVYTLTEYRKALGKMEFFLGILKPEVVFHQYHDMPSDSDYQKLITQTRQNLTIAYEYLGAKIAAVSIVEALAWATGGDAPVAMFLGDVRGYEAGLVERAEDQLPEIEAVSPENLNPLILELLEQGRTNPSDFDLQRSPLTAYIYRWLGKRKIEQVLFFAKELFAEKISHERFLEQIQEKIHPDLVRNFALACSKLAFTRQKALEKWI